MNYSSLDLDKKILVAGTLESLMRSRQAAYSASVEIPEMRPFFEAAESLYADLANSVGARYVPVFDERAHVDERVARGDRDHTFVRDNVGRGPGRP